MRRSRIDVLAVSLLLALVVIHTPAGNAAEDPSEADRALVAKVARRFFDVATPVAGWAWPPLVGIAKVDEINAFASMQLLRAGERPVLKDNPKVVWLDLSLPQPSNGEKPPPTGDLADRQKKGESPKAKLDDGDGRTDDGVSPVAHDEVRRPQPYIVLLQGFLDVVVRNREPYLAETFGHELSHVLLRHAENYGEGGAPLVSFAVRRQQETDADLLGMKLSLQADYPYDELMKAVRSWRNLDGAGNSIVALAQSHPGWTDRALRIDEKQSQLWMSLSAFENGVYFLMAENYPIAERCFAQVTKEMPRCHEAWANRGYCRLMRYCDGLEPDDLKEMALNQVVVGGFYRRAATIEVRGRNAELWFDAVGDLKQALLLNDSLILPKANLALAYLVHPDGRQTGRACELFGQVVEALKTESDENIDPLDRAALLVNAGVGEMANGDSEGAEKLFEQARTAYESVTKSAPTGPMLSAILYSQAAQMAASSHQPERNAAIAHFEEYLRTTNPAVAWWPLAFERYQGLCRLEKKEAMTRASLAHRQNLRFRPVTSIVIGEGQVLTLNDPLAHVNETIGEVKSSPVVRRTNLQRLISDRLGLEVLCSDRLVALRMRKATSPPVVLQASGPGGESREIRVGMPISEVDELLAGDEIGWDHRYGTQQTIIYRYFFRLGFGVRVGDEGMVTEIIVARIPNDAIVK